MISNKSSRTVAFTNSVCGFCGSIPTLPVMFSSPRYGFFRLASSLSVVVLPVPLPPSRARNSPLCSSKDKPLTTSGKSLSYLNQISRAETTVSVSGAFLFPSGIGFNSCVFAYSSSQFRPSQTEMGQTDLESVAAHIRMAAGMAKNIAFPLDFNSAPTSAGVPLQSSLPPSMTATRDAKENASSKRCSVRIIVVPSSRLILPSVAKKSDAAIGSS